MKKGIAFLMLAFTCLSNLANAQSPNWLWAKGIGNSVCNSISNDASGNVYVTGQFEGASITFGTITLTNTNPNYTDIFIVKYDSNGNELWAKSAGGTSTDNSYSSCVDPDGNIFITGSFYSPTITFDTTIIINEGNADIFLSKYDSTGNLIWATGAGGSDYDMSLKICSDLSGNVFITGLFESPTITFDTTTLSNAGNEDIFIAKYNAFGNLLWAKPAGGAGNDEGGSVCTDFKGNVFMTGGYGSATITFDTITFINGGQFDFFIVKFDANGNVDWARSPGDMSFCYSSSSITDAAGNVFVTGMFSPGPIIFGSTTLTSSGQCDIFIVKYDSIGNVLWAKSAGSAKDDYCNSIVADINGNTYLTGFFENAPITFGAITLTTAGVSDIYIVKYDTSGNVVWAKSAGGNTDDYGNCITVDVNGNVYLTGGFGSNSIVFGTTILSNVGGYDDLFIAKLEASTIGVEELFQQNNFSIAPNPFTSQTIITFIDEQKNTTIKIIDVLGNEIKNANFTGKQFILQKGEMNAGIYFVQTIDENKNMWNRKIIVE